MNIIQIFPVIIFMTHEALCQKDPRFLNPHRNQFYENRVVHEPVRRVPENVPRFEFSFDGLLSSLTAPFRQTLFPSREFPLIKRYSDPAPEEENYDYEDLMEKRKQDVTHNNRFKSDIMMLIAKKKHADMKQELHPHHYYSTKVKVQDEVDRDDDLGDDTEDEDWRWPHKVTNHKDKLKVEAMDKVFNVSPVLSAGGVKVRLLLQFFKQFVQCSGISRFNKRHQTSVL